MKIHVVLAMLLAGLCGCARQDSVVVTVAGKSHVELRGVDGACVHQAVLKELATYDWNVNSSSASQIVAQRVAPPWINTTVLSVAFETPQVRMTLTIVPAGPDVKVLIEPDLITNPGSLNERVQPIPVTARMNTVFDDSARRVEQACKAR